MNLAQLTCPRWSKGGDLRSSVFALVGSSPTVSITQCHQIEMFCRTPISSGVGVRREGPLGEVHTEIDSFFLAVHPVKSEADIGITKLNQLRTYDTMSDLKQTLTELVKYLDTVHRRNLPTARPGASTTQSVILYCRTDKEIGDTRFSADARAVIACKYLGVEGGWIGGKLKQAVIAARRGKRRGGNNAKWAQEFFASIKRIGGIALKETAAPVKAAPVQCKVEEEAAAAPAASHPGDDAPIDEGQWGGMGVGGVWDDEEAELAGAGFHMAQHPGAEIVLADTWEENWE